MHEETIFEDHTLGTCRRSRNVAHRPGAPWEAQSATTISWPTHAVIPLPLDQERLKHTQKRELRFVLLKLIVAHTLFVSAPSLGRTQREAQLATMNISTMDSVNGLKHCR